MASSGSGGPIGVQQPAGVPVNNPAMAHLQFKTRTYQIDKLTGPNYQVWRVRMEILLQRLDLWPMVDGSEADAGLADPDALMKHG